MKPECPPPDGPSRIENIQTRDVEYLRGRIKEVSDELEHIPGLFDSLRSWPPGANGPIAIAAYESLVFRAERAVFNLRAALMRTDREPLVVDDPVAAAWIQEIVDRRG